jgi:hypothetical protein
MGLLVLQVQYRAAVYVSKNLVLCKVPTKVGHEGAANELCQKGVDIHMIRFIPVRSSASNGGDCLGRNKLSATMTHPVAFLTDRDA